MTSGAVTVSLKNAGASTQTLRYTVTDRDGATLAFTADNAEATKNLCDAFTALLRDEGFSPET